jgi:hypothetical protein
MAITVQKASLGICRVMLGIERKPKRLPSSPAIKYEAYALTQPPADSLQHPRQVRKASAAWIVHIVRLLPWTIGGDFIKPVD